MSKVVFATIMPHPPLLLPHIGTEEDKKKVEKTITKMNIIGSLFAKKKIDIIIISSPHPDWGFNVPLYFLLSSTIKKNIFLENFAKYQYPQKINTEIENNKIIPIITTSDSPQMHYKLGENFYKTILKNNNLNIAVIASGDLSHHLKSDGPYNHHPDGEKFDKVMISSIKKKNIKRIINLEKKYPSAGECGLRSISFLFGILEAQYKETNKNYTSEIISYEAPFGVGYLIVNFNF